MWCFKEKINIFTLIYLITAQNIINKQECNFSKNLAGRINFEALINKQWEGAKTKNKGKPWHYKIELNFRLFTTSFIKHSLKLPQNLIEILLK